MNEVLQKLLFVIFVLAVSALNNSTVMAELLGNAVNFGIAQLLN
jgi:hypothetical protein